MRGSGRRGEGRGGEVGEGKRRGRKAGGGKPGGGREEGRVQEEAAHVHVPSHKTGVENVSKPVLPDLPLLPSHTHML